jgi:imidazolonepropionase
MSPTVIHNVRLITPVAKAGEVNWTLFDLPNAALFIENGHIKKVGLEKEVLAAAPADVERIDGQGKLLTPGLVDCHTHPVFNRTREHEFVRRVQGATYQEIAAEGGGILFSVRDLRQTSPEVLLEKLLRRLDRFLMHGTTTIEAKSGYGLSFESEILQLEIIRQAGQRHPVEMAPTFLGAHQIPEEPRKDRQRYLDLLTQEMLPAVAERKLATFADVFCEAHVFSVAESEKILTAASRLGLRPKIHADQLSNSGGTQVAIEVGAISADHLEYTPPDLYDAILEAGIVPVLLPGADFFINAPCYPAAREMIAAGLPVALSTDFNPGTCMTESLPMVMTLACLKLRMTPAEALVASTLHAARAINLDQRIGSLEVGKQADMVLWDAVNVETLAYHFGVNLVEKVIKSGKLVWNREKTNHV